MKTVAVVLFLACACSGAMVGPIGMNPWGLSGLGLDGLGLGGRVISGMGINGMGINGMGINGMGINGMGVRTLGVNNLGLMSGALPMAAPMAMRAPMTMAAPAPMAMAAPVPMAMAAPVPMAAPVALTAPAVTISQYHAQTELGEASHGYSFPGQAAANMRDAYGNQVGSYAYINPEGKEVKVSYTADARGFRVLSNDLPVAPIAPIPGPVVMPVPIMDAPDVIEAKIAHMAAMDAARSGMVVIPVNLPEPVQDTEEVTAAKAAHAEAMAVAKGEKEPEVTIDEEPKADEKEEDPVEEPAADAEEEKIEVESSRKKRQILPGLWGAAPLAIRSEPLMAGPIMTRTAVRTDIVHNPGHAMSYRID